MRKILRLLSLAAVLLLLTAIPAVAEDPGQGDPAQSLAGAVISEIVIVRHELFSAADGLPKGFPWRAANRVHIDTREEVIRRELLFSEGDRLDPVLIEETLRNLRALGFLHEERIECRPADDGTVVVLVETRETWTLGAIFDIDSINDQYSVTAGVIESNLLGRGKSLSFWGRKGLRHGTTVIEDTLSASYYDPGVLGSRVELYGHYTDFETGELYSGAVERPYFARSTRWSAGAEGYHRRITRRLIAAGAFTAEYEEELNVVTAQVGYAVRRLPDLVHRLGFYYTHEERLINDYAGHADSEPAGLTLSHPGISYRRLAARYIVERDVAQFDRNEDFNMGNDLVVQLGYSSEALGGDDDELIFRVADRQGLSFREGHFVVASIEYEGRYREELCDTVLSVGADYTLRKTPVDCLALKHTFHGEVLFRYGRNLAPENILWLGEGGDGLRGYPRGAFTGNRLTLLSIEDRIFPERKVLGLLAVGGLLFFETGYVWGEDEEIDVGDLKSDAGAGFRFALPSLSNENILRLTIAFPFSETDGSREPIYTVDLSSRF